VTVIKQKIVRGIHALFKKKVVSPRKPFSAEVVE
jgi:hypothetical protein